MSQSHNYNRSGNYYTFDHFLNSMKETNENSVTDIRQIDSDPNNLIGVLDPNQKSPVIEDLYKEKLERSELEYKIRELVSDIEREQDYSKELETNIDLIKSKYEKDIQLINMSNKEKDKVISQLHDTISKQNELNSNLMANIENYTELIEKMKNTIEVLSAEKQNQTGKVTVNNNDNSTKEIAELKNILIRKDQEIEKLQAACAQQDGFLDELTKMKQDLLAYAQRVKSMVELVQEKECTIEKLKNDLAEEKAKNEEIQKLLIEGQEGKNTDEITQKKLQFLQNSLEEEKKKNEEITKKCKEYETTLHDLTDSKVNMKQSFDNINDMNSDIIKENKELKAQNEELKYKLESFSDYQNNMEVIYQEIHRLKAENKILKEHLGIKSDNNDGAGEEGEEGEEGQEGGEGENLNNINHVDIENNNNNNNDINYDINNDNNNNNQNNDEQPVVPKSVNQLLGGDDEE